MKGKVIFLVHCTPPPWDLSIYKFQVDTSNAFWDMLWTDGRTDGWSEKRMDGYYYYEKAAGDNYSKKPIIRQGQCHLWMKVKVTWSIWGHIPKHYYFQIDVNPLRNNKEIQKSKNKQKFRYLTLNIQVIYEWRSRLVWSTWRHFPKHCSSIKTINWKVGNVDIILTNNTNLMYATDYKYKKILKRSFYSDI